MSKGFLSIYALIVLVLVSSVVSYFNLLIISSKDLEGSKVYEDILVLQRVQAYYEDNCQSEDSEITTFEFSSNHYDYSLESDGILYKNNMEYLRFTKQDEQCFYDSYSYINE